MKLLSIVGARPQFVKEATIQRALTSFPSITQVLVHTGQHYDANMSGEFFDVLSMRTPDYDLGIHASLHGEMTGRMLVELEQIMLREKPTVVMVYGDTNSTLAGSLAASKLNIPVAHVEAGLRQNPKSMPEEINRVLTDHVSQFLFAPSMLAVENLRKEGLGARTFLVGDVMYDIFLLTKPYFNYSAQHALNLDKNSYIVMTLHRDFNVDSEQILRAILLQVQAISAITPVVFPVHPRTRRRIKEFGLEEILAGIHVLPPIDYLSLMGLINNSSCVITDSGGVQKEAFFAGKRAAILMPDTGWRELVEMGYHVLTDAFTLRNALDSILEPKPVEQVYGTGNAAASIIGLLTEHLAAKN